MHDRNAVEPYILSTTYYESESESCGKEERERRREKKRSNTFEWQTESYLSDLKSISYRIDINYAVVIFVIKMVTPLLLSP